MGTRSLTVIQDSKKELCVIYRQFDGYPSGLGADLKAFLGEMRLVNGFGPKDEEGGAANGMGCLACQLIKNLKEGIGNVYLYPAGTRDCGEEYIYTLYQAGETGLLHLRVQSGGVTFFGMPGDKQDDMSILYDGPIADFDPAKAEAKQNEEQPA